MDKLFTRWARFGKTVEAAGRTLIGKQEEDLFWRSRSSYECDLQNKRFSPGFFCFLFNSSDGRVVRASASVAVDLGLIPSRVKSKAMTLKMVFIASLLDAQH